MQDISKLSQDVIKKISEYANDHFPLEQLELFKKFITLYFAQMPMTDLVNRPVSELYGMVFNHFKLLESRKPGELKIQIFNPQTDDSGWVSPYTVIQVVTDDMPFLVDSMRMEIDRLKHNIHLMIFSGGIKIKRDQHNHIMDAFSYHSAEQDCLIEAPIQMEIDRQTDPQVLAEIKKNLIRVLQDVRAAVSDWKRMCARLQSCIDEFNPEKMMQNKAQVTEAQSFLKWLLNNHFTFLGYREYEFVEEGHTQALRLIPNSGLGVLRDYTGSKILREYGDLPKKAREMALSTENLLIISKTNTLSTVHRPSYTDYVGVKRFNREGKLIGEHRFIGLYTSEAYRIDPREIPFIRQKVNEIIKLSLLPAQSHAGKDLIHIISTLPRDDLFHATTEELYQIARGILQMQDRRCTRLFIRNDAYGRFVSCLLYLPKENVDTKRINAVQTLLSNTFDALDISSMTRVSEAALARVHIVAKVNPRKRLSYDEDALEKRVIELTKSWQDGFYEQALIRFGDEEGRHYFKKYMDAFAVGYKDTFSATVAVEDIEQIEKLSQEQKLRIVFYRPAGASNQIIGFKLYNLHHPLSLSDIVPMLENMGLRVEEEQPYRITRQDHTVWINDYSMKYAKEPKFEMDRVKLIFQEAFLKIWEGEVENDALNRLVLEAELTWREISVLRGYMKYFRQIGFTFSEQYIATTLLKNHAITKLLVQYFTVKFVPNAQAVEHKLQELAGAIEIALEKVTILDEDRIIRRYLNLIQATLRTNYYQIDSNGNHKRYLSFKLNPALIPQLPLPLPKVEIFVYSPRFEGIHLRMAKVARGGIRWSDRPEDFRTEVLGLMKAQQVKNALIVPAGAKGGFVPKSLALEATREEILREGISCYEDYISGLLDVTDNLVEGNVVVHPNTTCYDDADPYIVVAADKGTATFSDIANRIAQERDYWLRDAFASGGSTGYDHKKMAITARGAWVSAERHFQNIGVDLEENEITVVGLGDMSGDVFGNGMLLSRHIKLVAAFNHQHIFLDPTPDPEKSYEERKRLFNLPRSSWEDYDKNLISVGGGVYSRSSKAISLSPEVKKLLLVEEERLEPNDLIKAILKASVDLFWNGGIGTYVKASSELNSEVGDRSNDNVRVNGRELNARVVCEGGNLGFTQKGRIEYELAGGRMNTDFIDNSGGVDASDHEVNIKILLNQVVRSGVMNYVERNQLLVEMTDDVSRLVLTDNYLQNRIISFTSYYSTSMLLLLLSYIQDLEKRGLLNRKLEFLPDDKTILERRTIGKGLTRAEISVLLAYSKNSLKAEIMRSDLMSDQTVTQIALHAFPAQLGKRFYQQIMDHYLAKEIIATQLSNRLVSEMGLAFVYQMQDETGSSVSQIIQAYSAAREIFALEQFNSEIESLDYLVDAELQYKMMFQGIRVVRRATRWFLRNRRDNLDVVKNIEEFGYNVGIIYQRLPKLMLGVHKDRFDKHVASLVAQHVPNEIAIKIASSARIYHALNIIEASNLFNANIFRVAKIYFMLVDRLDLLWFRDQVNQFPINNHWSVLAKAAYKGDLDWVQRMLTVGVLKVEAKSIPGKMKQWFSLHRAAIARWKSILADLRSAETPEFAIMFVAIRELIDLADISTREKTARSMRAGEVAVADDDQPIDPIGKI